jgi:uncharacterized membrane protein YhaH (DUF805 family)
MEWYLKVLRQYADFNGRARRKEYWMFVLFNFIIMFGGMIVLGIIAQIIESMTFTVSADSQVAQAKGSGNGVVAIVVILYVLATIIPSLAVAVRRLHDTNQSGWMMLIGLIPVLGGIWLLMSMVEEGDKGDNKYGPDPKRITHSQ